MKQDRGLSLLELVAVLAIFSMVSLIGVQVIQASVRANSRLVEVSDQARAISLTVATLRQDLDNAAARRFRPGGSAQISALKTGIDGFSLSVSGLARIDQNTTGFGRVNWRFDAAKSALFRSVATSLYPAGQRTNEVLMLNGVSRFSIQSFQLPAGWRNGFAHDPRIADQLPLGIRVTFTHDEFGEITVMVSNR